MARISFIPLLLWILWQVQGSATAAMEPSLFKPSGEPFTFEVADGTTFTGLRWEPASGLPVGIVVAVHGLSGAASDFEPAGDYLRDRGFALWSYNLRGMGKDPVEKRRGDLKRVDAWYGDLQAVLEAARSAHPGTPVYLLGESMGALIALQYARRGEKAAALDGLILSAPVVELEGELSWWQEFLARVFLLVAPWKRLDLGAMGEEASDPETVNRVTRDPHYHAYLEQAPHRISSFSLRFLKQFMKLVEGASPTAEEIQVPVLVLYAEHDIFVKPEAVERFIRFFPEEGVEATYFPEAYHLLFHDPDTPKVLKRVEDWLRTRSPGSG